MSDTPYTYLSLFCGLGGMSLGFERAGFRCVGAFDSDPEAVADHERVAGVPAQVADLATMTPAALRDACSGRPDVLVTSPPCKGFSSCLPRKEAGREKYKRLNELSFRGVWIALEAWSDDPPGLILFENVPRIQTRGAAYLERVEKLLGAYGYVCRRTTHCCGELGGLAQRRHRFLLVARHISSVPELLYEPPKRALKSVGEVLGELPVPLPDDDAGGPMHALCRLGNLNWLRLALIPAGRDWRALPEEVKLAPRQGRHNGGYGVADWCEQSHAVVGHAQVAVSWASVTDPRLHAKGNRHHGGYGACRWQDPSGVVVASADPKIHRVSVTDPRLAHAPRAGGHRVDAWTGQTQCVIGDARPCKGSTVADPRLGCDPRSGVLGVQGEGPAVCVVGNARPDNGAYSVADPRVERPRRECGHGVIPWSASSWPIIGAARIHNSPIAVQEPRLATPTHVLEDGVLYGPPLPLGRYDRGYPIIRAEDGTWHRPLTTLELAALQGLPVGDAPSGWLQLEGGSKKRWRQRIGNACPPPTAEAIAGQMLRTLEASAEGALLMSSTPVWVERRMELGGEYA